MPLLCAPIANWGLGSAVHILSEHSCIYAVKFVYLLYIYILRCCGWPFPKDLTYILTYTFRLRGCGRGRAGGCGRRWSDGVWRAEGVELREMMCKSDNKLFATGRIDGRIFSPRKTLPSTYGDCAGASVFAKRTAEGARAPPAPTIDELRPLWQYAPCSSHQTYSTSMDCRVLLHNRHALTSMPLSPPGGRTPGKLQGELWICIAHRKQNVPTRKTACKRSTRVY